MTEAASRMGIDHVVVLMLENRSFDSVLGSLKLSGRPVDGLDASMSNADSSGESIKVGVSVSGVTQPDPHHGLEDVLVQLTGPNQGFVIDYETTLKPEEWPLRRQVMDYQTASTMPVLYALADEYAVCDRWFSSVPAETYPNRLFVHCGSSGGKVSDRLWHWFPPSLYTMPSVFDLLGVELTDWAVYNDQIPNALLLGKLADEFIRSRHVSDSHFRSLDQFEQDCQADALPRYAFIEPKYLFDNPDDDHPPHLLADGERLIARVYLALRSSPAWKQSLLLVLYDEHGGFFDHCPPPTEVLAPGDEPARELERGFGFTRLGPRVPCVLISAWTDRGKVFGSPDGSVYDHTSVIATLRGRWNLGPLTKRDEAALPLWPVLDRSAPRDDDADMPALIASLRDALPPIGAAAVRAPGKRHLSGRQAASVAAVIGPVARLPGIRRRQQPGQRPRIEIKTAGLAAFVALRSLIPRNRSAFAPTRTTVPRP